MFNVNKTFKKESIMTEVLDGRTVNKVGGVVWYKDGLLHREDGPAVERPSGYKAWYQNDVLHRTDGPAVEYSDGTKAWFLNGKKHRVDDPAIVHIHGQKEWFVEGVRHRTDGPAVECENGTKIWYLYGEVHHTDGPAVEYPNGSKEWWLNDVQLSEKEFMEKTMSDEKVAKPATKKQVNETAVRNTVTAAMENETSKFDFSNIARLILDLQDVLKENKQLNAIKEENKALKAEIRTLKKQFQEHTNKMRENQLNLCLALVKEAPQEYFMTVAAHNQAITLDDVAAEHGLYMFCLERVDSGKGLESEFRVGFKAQSENTTPVESMKKFIACFKEVK